MNHTPQSLARQFCLGVYVNEVSPRLWQQTFEYLAGAVEAAAFQPQKIQVLWTIYGGDVRARVRNDSLLLNVLKKALPGHDGNGVTLYRGESWFLFDQNQVGFCWSASEEVATRYAKGLNAVESGGVLLKCHAPPEAILAAPQDTSLTPHADVYICDPTSLLRLTTLALFPKL